MTTRKGSLATVRFHHDAHLFRNFVLLLQQQHVLHQLRHNARTLCFIVPELFLRRFISLLCRLPMRPLRTQVSQSSISPHRFNHPLQSLLLAAQMTRLRILSNTYTLPSPTSTPTNHRRCESPDQRKEGRKEGRKDASLASGAVRRGETEQTRADQTP